MCSIKPWKMKSPGSKPLLHAEKKHVQLGLLTQRPHFYPSPCPWTVPGIRVWTCWYSGVKGACPSIQMADGWCLGVERTRPSAGLLSRSAHWYRPHVSWPPLENQIFIRSQMEMGRGRFWLLVLTKFNICKDVRMLWIELCPLKFICWSANS